GGVIGDHDVQAVGGQAAADVRTDAAGAAGDENGFAHGEALLRLRFFREAIIDAIAAQISPRLARRQWTRVASLEGGGSGEGRCRMPGRSSSPFTRRGPGRLK